MIVKYLKEALKDIPDDLEICLELFGNQHDCDEVGLAVEDSDGAYRFTDDIEEGDEVNFLICGL